MNDHPVSLHHPSQGAPVWVCGDHMVSQEEIHSILEEEGYAVRTFCHPEELLKALKNHSQQLPAAIFIDVVMPGIRVLETCQLIRRGYSPTRLPVIMVTTRSSPIDLQAALDAGASDCVYKPVVRQELLARMELHLALTQAVAKQKLHNTQLRLIKTVISLVEFKRDPHEYRENSNGATDETPHGGLSQIIREINRSIMKQKEAQPSTVTSAGVLRELSEEHKRLSREILRIPECEGIAEEPSPMEDTTPGLSVILEKLLSLLNESASGDISVDGDRLGLSPREAEIAEAVCLGYGNGEIASNLEISENTVKRHLYNTYNKLGVGSRAQLVHKILVKL